MVNKQLGCAIGVAMGTTFCGVTGSSSIACRWDITGPPPVRAARLMQYALNNNIEVAIDESLFSDSLAATRVSLLDPAVELKGSRKPCSVYRLSGSSLYSAFRVLESFTSEAPNKAVQQVQKSINTGRARCGVILSGFLFAGKKRVAQLAAASCNLVPYSVSRLLLSRFLIVIGT